MAFSATVRGIAFLGGQGGIKVMYGDWSGLAGDAAGTLSIGGKLIGSLWFKNDTTTTNQQTSQIFPVVNWDGNIPGTLTIQNQDNVTTGSFILFTLGS
jgi:hypothetical protein